MNLKQLKIALPVLLKHNICPFIWGSQGIGKTSAIKQYCKEQGLDLVTLYTASQDVGDLIGLLVKSNDSESVHHARPSWFPTEGKGIVFLDELNRAHPDVIQAMFPFILEGKLHTHKLPEGWKIVAAGNYNSDQFQVTDTSDAAWLSRFCHLDFTPSVEEWIVHATNRGMFAVADFIREQPTMLELSAKNAGRLDTSFIVPDRRATAEGVGQLELSGELPEEMQYEVYSGLIGTAAAAAFMSWKNKPDKALSLGTILASYHDKGRKRVLGITEDKKAVRLDLLNQPIDELFVALDNNPSLLSANGYLENFKQYLLDIPAELSMKAFTGLVNIRQFYGKFELLNDPDYVKLFMKEVKNGKR